MAFRKKYLLPIHLCKIGAQIKSILRMHQNVNNTFSILKKAHAYFHTIIKTNIQFKKDLPTTVEGVARIRYLLSYIHLRSIRA